MATAAQNWSLAPPADLAVTIGSKGTHECNTYKTAGEIVQLLALADSVAHKSRFLYIGALLQHLFPRMLGPRGMLVSGSTQKELFAVLLSACRMAPLLSGTFLQTLYRTVQTAEESIARCHDGNTRFRSEQLCACKVYLHCRDGHDAPHSAVGLMDMPEDVVKRILSFLDDPEDLLEVSFSCRAARYLCGDPWLWRGMCQRYFLADLERLQPPPAQWRELFGRCARQHGPVWLGPQDALVVCVPCQLLLWASTAHRCPTHPVPAAAFLSHFFV